MKTASVALVVLLFGCSLVTDSRSLTFRDDARADGDASIPDSSIDGALEDAGSRCDNDARDGLETDVDCGGLDCPACSVDQDCSIDTDCTTRFCNVGTCRPPGEDCGNGIDDDADGDVDCMDADCTSHDCVPSLPGWEGPVRLDRGMGALPSCSGAFPLVAYEGNRDLTCADASCAACSCEASGAVCPDARAQWFQMSDCMGEMATHFTSAAPSCDPFSFSFGNPSSVIVTARTATGGTCRASGGDATIVPASWGEAARACATDQAPSIGGCTATEICVPRPEGGVCFHREGDVACPAAYPDRHVFHASFEDTRACTVCACDGFVGQPCSGNVAVYSNTSCTGGHQGIGTGMGCVNFPNTREAASFTGSPPTGSCPPTGGVQSGSCTPTSPTTFCCLR